MRCSDPRGQGAGCTRPGRIRGVAVSSCIGMRPCALRACRREGDVDFSQVVGCGGRSFCGHTCACSPWSALWRYCSWPALLPPGWLSDASVQILVVSPGGLSITTCSRLLVRALKSAGRHSTYGPSRRSSQPARPPATPRRRQGWRGSRRPPLRLQHDGCRPLDAGGGPPAPPRGRTPHGSRLGWAGRAAGKKTCPWPALDRLCRHGIVCVCV